MTNNNFLAKIPLFVGITGAAAGWFLITIFLISGKKVVSPKKAELYFQQPTRPLSSPVNWEASEKVVCYHSGGRWLEFASGCADNCTSARNPQAVCAQVQAFSCDCGPSQCWDTNTFTCQPN